MVCYDVPQKLLVSKKLIGEILVPEHFNHALVQTITHFVLYTSIA